MAACNLDTLLTDAATNRFTGATDDKQNALVLQLLCNISSALGMTCNIDTLLADAATNRFTGCTPDKQNALILQLLCDISNGVSGGGGTQQVYYDTTATPADITKPALRYPQTGGVLEQWDGGAWV